MVMPESILSYNMKNKKIKECISAVKHIDFDAYLFKQF